MYVDVVCQCEVSERGQQQSQAGDVDGSHNVLGIVETFDLDSWDTNGQEKGHNLKQSLVDRENTHCYPLSSRMTNQNVMFGYILHFL